MSDVGLLLAFPRSTAAIYAGIALFGLSVGNVITLPAVIVHAEFNDGLVRDRSSD